jgi:hypothetical protein
VNVYQQWIDEWLQNNNPMGRCAGATKEMHEAFPELRLVCGHVYSISHGCSQHWWLETVDDEIIDPTASQFSMIGSYKEYQEGDEVRVGKCMNCGDDIYGHSLKDGSKSVCSEECNQELCRSFRSF